MAQMHDEFWCGNCGATDTNEQKCCQDMTTEEYQQRLRSIGLMPKISNDPLKANQS